MELGSYRTRSSLRFKSSGLMLCRTRRTPATLPLKTRWFCLPTMDGAWEAKTTPYGAYGNQTPVHNKFGTQYSSPLPSTVQDLTSYMQIHPTQPQEDTNVFSIGTKQPENPFIEWR